MGVEDSTNITDVKCVDRVERRRAAFHMLPDKVGVEVKQIRRSYLVIKSSLALAEGTRG